MKIQIVEKLNQFLSNHKMKDEYEGFTLPLSILEI